MCVTRTERLLIATSDGYTTWQLAIITYVVIENEKQTIKHIQKCLVRGSNQRPLDCNQGFRISELSNQLRYRGQKMFAYFFESGYAIDKKSG